MGIAGRGTEGDKRMLIPPGVKGPPLSLADERGVLGTVGETPAADA